MTDTNEVTLPMQGLAAYLRCEAGGVFLGHPSHDALMQWAKEVEAATQDKRQPLTDGDAKDAERYRYIRSQMESGAVQTQLPLTRSIYWVGSYVDCADPKHADGAIDAAIASQKAAHGITATPQGKL